MFALSGRTIDTLTPSDAPNAASEIPVLPELESRISFPLVSLPSSSATFIILAAARSFTEPVGLRNSAFAKSLPDVFPSLMSGVFPTESRMELDTISFQFVISRLGG